MFLFYLKRDGIFGYGSRVTFGLLEIFIQTLGYYDAFLFGLEKGDGFCNSQSDYSAKSTILGFWFRERTVAFDRNCLVPLLRNGFGYFEGGIDNYDIFLLLKIPNYN